MEKIKALMPKIIAWVGWLIAALMAASTFLVENPLPEDVPADSTVAVSVVID